MEADTKAGAAQALSLPQIKVSRVVLLEMLWHRGVLGGEKAEITENLPRFIKQFEVSCVSSGG